MSIHNSNIAEDVKVMMLKGEKGDPTPPTDEQVAEALETMGEPWVDAWLNDDNGANAIADWLTNHPEATTTVQDGSLTEAKFSNALKLKTIKDYVTPEMFGAVGDGTTDDTTAFINCFASLTDGGYVLISENSYVVNDYITIPDNTEVLCLGTINYTLEATNPSKGLFEFDGDNIVWQGGTIIGAGASSAYIDLSCVMHSDSHSLQT